MAAQIYNLDEQIESGLFGLMDGETAGVGFYRTVEAATLYSRYGLDESAFLQAISKRGNWSDEETWSFLAVTGDGKTWKCYAIRTKTADYQKALADPTTNFDVKRPIGRLLAEELFPMFLENNYVYRSW